MLQRLTLTLPKKISTNKIYEGCHWTQRKKDKDLFLWAMVGSKTKIHPVSQCSLSFYFTFKNRPLDCTNCTYMVKLIEDALKHYRIIPDDSPKYVKAVSITSKKGETDNVEIIIDNLQRETFC